MLNTYHSSGDSSTPFEIAQTMRCLIISDTHDSAFPHITAKVDVAVHCGDMTMIGGLSNYRKALDHLGNLDAELKFVIAGNHDVSLDPKWWAENLDEEGGDDPEEQAKARQLFDAARERGVHLLDEGLYTFTLSDDWSFKIFASPFTPEYGGYAFSYHRDEDHFNEGPSSIPEGVDIVMTHGPPLPTRASSSSSAAYHLDLGHGGEHCGCPKLFDAIVRSRPKLHCFGHIHEGHGIQSLVWPQGEDGDGFSLQGLVKDTSLVHATEEGRTLLVNAAIMGHGGEPNNEPWVVDVELGGHI